MKKEGWEVFLYDYIEKQTFLPFEWGKNDCVVFAADFVKQVTGIDCLGDMRDQYMNEKTARAFCAKLKVTPEKTVDTFFERVTPAFAKRGDIAFKRKNDGFSFGIVCDGKVFFKTENIGMVTEPLKSMDIVWSI